MENNNKMITNLIVVIVMIITFMQTAYAEILFSDNFDDNLLDSNKWIPVGNKVTEQNNMMRINYAVTDAGGNLHSNWFEINQEVDLIIKRKVKVNYANKNYVGRLEIQLNNSPETNFGVIYGNAEYSQDVYTSVFGFFLYKNSVNTHPHKNDLIDMGERINPIWDQWFDEKFIYHFETGILEYFINSEKIQEYNVGVLPELEEYKIRFHLNAWGWFPGHYQYFDDFEVTQKVVIKNLTSAQSTQIQLGITQGTTSIFAPSVIEFGQITASNTEQVIEINSSDNFSIEDLKGSEAGYYTTLSVGNLTKDDSNSISSQNLQIKVDNGVETIAGTRDDNVIAPAILYSTFTSNSPITLIERNISSNGKLGKYGVNPKFQLTIPPYQTIGSYSGTITYTLIEN